MQPREIHPRSRSCPSHPFPLDFILSDTKWPKAIWYCVNHKLGREAEGPDLIYGTKQAGLRPACVLRQMGPKDPFDE